MPPVQMKDHDKAVTAIANKISTFHRNKQQWKVYHGSTSSTRVQNFSRNAIIDTSSLNHILSISNSSMTALVEPNVSMEKLVEATLAQGLLPPVVMEFPAITVGGGFSGTSAESSSFKHGLFEETIRSIEIVLADGEVMKASETENQELLHAAAGAFGTVGVVTMLEVALIEAKPYVELEYLPVQSMNDAIETMEQAMKSGTHQYVDAIMYSATSGVVMIGNLVSTPSTTSPASLAQFHRARDPLFYQHVERILHAHNSPGSQRSQTQTQTQPHPPPNLIPIQSYLFRYDRGAFWGAKWAFAYFLTPLNSLTTFLLNPFLKTNTMYAALHKSGLAEQFIVQDCVFPADRAEEFVAYCGHRLGFWPMWLCPLNFARGVMGHGVHPKLFDFADADEDGEGKSGGSRTKRKWLCNVGIWGPGPKKHEEFVQLNREIEGKVKELGGVKTLYAHTYYTEEEFDAIYDRKRYDMLRTKYHAEGLPSVYEKVRVDVTKRRKVVSGIKAVWPLGGLYGVLCVLLGSDYLMVSDGSFFTPSRVVVAILVAATAILCTRVVQ